MSKAKTEEVVQEEVKKTEKPNWVKLSPKELEKLIVELGKEGKSPAQIGIILRDQHAIPKAKLLGKKICQILEENKVKFESEKEILERKIKVLNEHIKTKSHDYSAKRSLTKKLWTLNKLQ
jgi:small subunit ribosomal protein S15